MPPNQDLLEHRQTLQVLAVQVQAIPKVIKRLAGPRAEPIKLVLGHVLSLVPRSEAHLRPTHSPSPEAIHTRLKSSTTRHDHARPHARPAHVEDGIRSPVVLHGPHARHPPHEKGPIFALDVIGGKGGVAARTRVAGGGGIAHT